MAVNLAGVPAFQENGDILVAAGNIQATLPIPMNYILETMVTFYPQELLSFVLCNVPNCNGHFQFGLVVDTNVPVIFGHHRQEIAFYFPLVTKSTLPYRIPLSTGKLVDGIKWYSATPRDGQVGMRMTCMIDGFLMDLKVRTLDMGFCSACLFVSKGGPGRHVERIIRTIMQYIFLVAKPQPGEDGIHQTCRRFTYEQQLYIKRIWIDRLYEHGEICDEIQNLRMPDGTIRQSLISDLGFDPRNNHEPMRPRQTQYRLVIENLQPISWFFADIRCACGQFRQRQFQLLRFQAVPLLRGTHVSVEPAFLTFNRHTLEFDEDYWMNGAEFDRWNTSNVTRNLSKKVSGTPCRNCDQPMQVYNLGVPETTWMLVVEVPNVYKFTLAYTELPVAVIMAGESFELCWVAYMKDYTHYISLHRVCGHWFYYDDIISGTGGRPCPFRRINHRLFQGHRLDYTMERAFYIRTANKNPHRCLRLADQEAAAAAQAAQIRVR